MFPLNNLARKGLTLVTQKSQWQVYVWWSHLVDIPGQSLQASTGNLPIIELNDF